MSDISGVLQDVIARKLPSGKDVFDVVIAGQKYGFGFFAPKAKKGDYVTAGLTEERGFKNITKNTLKVSDYKPPAEEIPQATAPVYASRSTTSSAFDARQDTISRQAASNTALQFIELLERQEALPIPASIKSKAAKEDVLREILFKYASELYEFNTGIKFKDIRPATPKTEEVAAAGTPADEEWS